MSLLSFSWSSDSLTLPMQIQNTNSNARYSAPVRIGMGLGFDTQSCEGGHGLSWHLANWSTHACKKQSIEPDTFFNVHKYISVFKQIYMKKKKEHFYETNPFGQIHFTMYTNRVQNINKYILQIDPPMPARTNQLGLTKTIHSTHQPEINRSIFCKFSILITMMIHGY